MGAVFEGHVRWTVSPTNLPVRSRQHESDPESIRPFKLFAEKLPTLSQTHSLLLLDDKVSSRSPSFPLFVPSRLLTSPFLASRSTTTPPFSPVQKARSWPDASTRTASTRNQMRMKPPTVTTSFALPTRSSPLELFFSSRKDLSSIPLRADPSSTAWRAPHLLVVQTS